MSICPLCKQDLRGGGPTMHRVWQEMESDATCLIAVHVDCAWSAIREELYHRDGDCPFLNGYPVPDPPSNEERWIGWEPMRNLEAVLS